MNEQELAPHRANGRIPQRIKTIIPGTTVVILENDDVICMQVTPTDVMRVVGQKDANGMQAYEMVPQVVVARPVPEGHHVGDAAQSAARGMVGAAPD